MYLVIDANVVFSCLIKGKSLEILFDVYDKGIDVVTPEYLVDELSNNLGSLSKASGLSEDELIASSYLLFSEFIKVVPTSEYEEFISEAKKISPDTKDIPYFAVSLRFDKAPIWSREPKLKRQKVVKVLDDKEVEELLKS